MRGPPACDGAKQVGGRKRVLMVDTEGHIPAPADVQDSDTLPTLDEGKPLWPSLRLERIPTKWMPVRRKNARQNKTLETPT